jgi:hypothetical protein
MHPLKKKELLQKTFKKKNEDRIKNNRPLITVDKLNLNFEPSTFDYFRYIDGEVNDNE